MTISEVRLYKNRGLFDKKMTLDITIPVVVSVLFISAIVILIVYCVKCKM